MNKEKLNKVKSLIQRKKEFEEFISAIKHNDVKVICEYKLSFLNWVYQYAITDKSFISEVRQLAEKHLERINKEIEEL